MKRQNRIWIMVTAILLSLVVLTGCSVLQSRSSHTQNKVQNEITNKVVQYENITIADLENCILNTSKMLENSVIGITLKANYKTMINGHMITSEDTESIGSGVIYKRETNYNLEGKVNNYTYYVVTNRHVITGSNQGYTYKTYAYLGNEDVEIEAEVVGYDTKVDIALVKFQHTTLIQPVEFADSDTIQKGQFAIAIGNPDGYEYYGSVTFGIISGELRYISEDTDGDKVNDFNAAYIQHDVTINPGNSGGGLFTIDGKLIGINTLKIVDDKIDNMGFAIPANIVKSLLENYLEQGKTIVRPRLGIVGIEVRNLSNAIIAQNQLKEIPTTIYGSIKPYGIYVTEVTENGTMSQTSLQKDDIILAFEDEPLTQMTILTGKLNALTDYVVGSKVEITYYSRRLNKIVMETVKLR
ncbi:MAG: trypsin-like peptidase domain-containing protein [Anaeroplasma bactoclasticum]|nr:trypsin-like peptidase domain-containing protein [Anaeroplasma bactoclasticum]